MLQLTGGERGQRTRKAKGVVRELVRRGQLLRAVLALPELDQFREAEEHIVTRL